ncbi:MAG: ribosome-associated translation inhibitor RaiA [Bryobacterales bacterium]|nr:ribosome-associated translation inhibitor RaiA [Bryobacterales bacterium]
MKIHYTGRTEELTPAQQRKLEAKFARLARMLDMKLGEREAHVILRTERYVHQAEITVRFHDHDLVGVGSGADDFTAIHQAIEKLEKQVQKLREKWRDLKRTPREEWPELEGGAAGQEEFPEEGPQRPAPRVYRVVDNHAGRKPMTLEEALLEMEGDRDYLVFRDAETDRFSVLVRRRDGNFDLIQE